MHTTSVCKHKQKTSYTSTVTRAAQVINLIIILNFIVCLHFIRQKYANGGHSCAETAQTLRNSGRSVLISNFLHRDKTAFSNTIHQHPLSRDWQNARSFIKIQDTNITTNSQVFQFNRNMRLIIKHSSHHVYRFLCVFQLTQLFFLTVSISFLY